MAAAKPYTITNQASGTASLVGIQNLAISGVLGFERSTFNQDIERTLTVGGITKTLKVAKNTLRFGGQNVQITAAGQTLSGDFSFSEDSANHVLSVQASNVNLSLGDGTNELVHATGSGSLTVSSAGVVGSITASVSANLPGVQLTAGNDYGKDRLYFGPIDSHIEPTWSPDGEELILVSNRGIPLGSGSIWRMPVRPDGIGTGTE